MSGRTSTHARLLAVASLPPGAREVPPWAVLAAVAAGLLVVAVLVVVLYKFGFFRRHRVGDRGSKDGPDANRELLLSAKVSRSNGCGAQAQTRDRRSASSSRLFRDDYMTS